MERITVLIASVLEREEQLKIVVERIAQQYGGHKVIIQLVLNFYNEVPEWLSQFDFVVPHLNPNNTNAHDSIWEFVPNDGYIFIMDDDIFYPLDFFENLILSVERHKRRAVCTCHGSNFLLPAKDYMDSRVTYGFTDKMERDIFVDLCGVGVCAWHTDTFDKQPALADFRIPFMRDLFFSKFCLHRDVKIVNIQRPGNWLQGLETPGLSVWSQTINNSGLRGLKNQVFKYEYLPALYTNQNGFGNEYVLFAQTGDFDRRLLDTALSTLVDVNPKVNIIVFSDAQKDFSFWEDRYSATVKRPVLTVYITPDEYRLGRAGSKVLTQYRFVTVLPKDSKVLLSDADVLFLRDPMKAFDTEFDLGVTTRDEPYRYPINAGIYYMRVSDKLNEYLRFVVDNLNTLNWPEFEKYQKQHGHSGTDWCWGQDSLCVTYLHTEQMKERFGIDVVDLGFYWNMCPHADGSAEQIASGKAKLMRAFHDESVATLHLKSRLRELLFDGLLP